MVAPQSRPPEGGFALFGKSPPLRVGAVASSRGARIPPKGGCQQVPIAPVRLKEAQSISPSNQGGMDRADHLFPRPGKRRILCPSGKGHALVDAHLVKLPPKGGSKDSPVVGGGSGEGSPRSGGCQGGFKWWVKQTPSFLLAIREGGLLTSEATLGGVE
ncbi:hypothetical protein RRG08_057331 [Elysia crispata]|uniref:Uncharacterized protein n=1 Tax=Elysia crispata TaxID=231223 RepID=A0AAE0YJE0_9GAST|nr:hypothetical protein RRG08_057331 [Elysia crispata]